jgi:hypothetical protein
MIYLMLSRVFDLPKMLGYYGSGYWAHLFLSFLESMLTYFHDLSQILFSLLFLYIICAIALLVGSFQQISGNIVENRLSQIVKLTVRYSYSGKEVEESTVLDFLSYLENTSSYDPGVPKFSAQPL